jgi:hypothetical protein
VEALESGVVTVTGQREPVEVINKPLEEVPWRILDARCWRLHREKSRFEVLSAPGIELVTLRRAFLALPGESRSGSHSDTAVHGVRTKAEKIKAASKLMDRYNLNTMGSSRIARELHEISELSLKELEKVATTKRGFALGVGRPPGSKKKK